MEQEGLEFCRRMRPRLVGALGLLCGDVHVAEELAQETLARVWSRWREVRELSEPAASAWTYRVAVNLCNSWWRRRYAERRALARLAGMGRQIGGEPDAADAIAVRTAVGELPRRQRTAVVLRYYADLPIADVASLMGCATGSVKSLTSLGLRTLRKKLTPEDSVEVFDGS